jgi:hypothetical protein
MRLTNIKLRFAALGLFAAVCGCTFHRQPYITYQSSATPLEETSVFGIDLSSARGGWTVTHISHVDGKEMPRAEAGYPYWVRVLSGSHTFGIESCTAGLASAVPLVVANRCEHRSVTLSEMQPTHVYVVEQTNTKFKDLGANPKYGIALGKAGLNQKIYYVKFDSRDTNLTAPSQAAVEPFAIQMGHSINPIESRHENVAAPVKSVVAQKSHRALAAAEESELSSQSRRAGGVWAAGAEAVAQERGCAIRPVAALASRNQSVETYKLLCADASVMRVSCSVDGCTANR